MNKIKFYLLKFYILMNQIGMNPMLMNQIGMNPMLMNQMGGNPMLINQMGMNPMQINPIGLNNQPNQINQMNMDNISLIIKNIVQPYENKIKELEEIIRQKEFEITVLKQKLNIQNSSINNINFMNINPMMPNPNINTTISQMPLKQIENKDNEFNLKIVSGNDEFMIKCLKSDKISIIREKCYIKEEILIYNYIILTEHKIFKDYEEYGITKFPVIIAKSVNSRNVIFQDISGFKFNMTLWDDCPLNIALIYYMIRIMNPLKLVENLNDTIDIIFTYNADKLSIKNKTPIKNIFINNPNPIITVDMKYF